MTALQLVVADAQTKSANGAEGLLVFLFLAVALFPLAGRQVLRALPG